MAVGQQERATFYSIYEGKICRTFKAPTKFSKPRQNKNNVTVHEEYYDYIDGLLVSIEVKEHKEYGKFWMIGLMDGDALQVLQLNWSSGYSVAFLKILPNVDFEHKVKIVPSLKMEGEKKRTTVFITQHGKPIPWYWTRENPGDLPPLAKVKFKGKESWDDTEMMEFLHDYVMDEIVPQLPGRSRKSAEPAESSASDLHPEGVEGSTTTEPIDDLPF